MGCDSSQHIQEENQKKGNEIDEGDDNEPKAQKKNDGANNEEVINKEGNKANKDNRKNKKDKRRKRDMKNQQEFRMSENDNSLSNSDTYKIKKKEKKILRSSKKRDNSDNSEEEDNKEDNSNINTEGMNTVETRKFNIKKKENEGLLIMDGVEDLIPEDLTEDDIYQLVEDALSENIVDSEDKKIPGTITRKQAKSIATILFKKLKKKKGKHNIDISDYPELKGVNVKIGAGLLTKDVIKDMMFNDDNIDQKQVDKTYAKLTKNSSDIRALTIELITNDTDNENNKDEKNSEKKS
jgi:hypothetical protein